MKRLKVVSTVLAMVTVAYAFSSGPPPGFTAAPGEDARACTRCHAGSLNPDGRGRVSIGGLPSNYAPGERYFLTLSVSHPDADRRRWGFQITALTQNTNQPAGSFEITDASFTQKVTGGPGGSRQYIEHTARGTASGTAGGRMWSFVWVAPGLDVGPVAFYATGNAANGSGNPVGDKVYTISVLSGAPLRFQDVAPGVGLVVQGGGNGLAWGDYNGDGLPDLYVARDGHDLLFRNSSSGTLTEVAASLGILDNDQGQDAAWFDYDNDRDLDLFVVNRGQSRLYRNDGPSAFSDVTETANLRGEFVSYAIAVADYDHDGDLDLFLANDGPNVLDRNNGDGTFTEVADLLNLAGNQTSLGAAWGDFDGDGTLELFVANLGPDELYRRDPRISASVFVDVATRAGVADSTASFAAAWADYDKDGRLDLFVAHDGANLLYRNRGDGTFENAASVAGVAGRGASRTAAWQDFDRDGDLDLFVDNQGGKGFLYRNEGMGTFREVAAQLGIAVNASSRDAVWVDFNRDDAPDLSVIDASGLHLFRNPRFR